MNDDDNMASAIVLVAIVCIIIWACSGCATPAKVDGDERPPEQGRAESSAPMPLERARMTASTPIIRGEIEPAPIDIEALRVALAASPTNSIKRGRFVKPRNMTEAQFQAWKKARGY